jgi:O-antigen ligase
MGFAPAREGQRMIERYSRGLGLAAAVVMTAAVLLLPVTSMPVLSRLMDNSLVAPPSAVLIALMTVLWLPVFIVRGGLIPRESVPLWVFFYIALISAGLAFFRIYPSFKGYTVSRNETSALLTMVMAGAFYLVFALYYRGSPKLKSFFAALNFSGLLLLAWSLAQLYIIITTRGDYHGWMVRFQDLISIRPLTAHTFYDRVTGFAYEPSWLGNMLNLLYLPYWLAATVTGFSCFRKRWGISIENLLLVLGVLILLFSFSRIGLAAFLLTLAYLALSLLLRFGRWIARRAAERFGFSSGRWLNLALGVLVTVGLLILFLLATLGLLRALSAYDNRVARLFNPESYRTSDPYQLADNLAFGERLVYWAVGWRVFSDYPLLGVGPGNAGYFFMGKLPIEGWQLVETIRIADALGYLPNVKSLWSRLLAETGLFGFSALFAWLFVVWRAAGFLKSRPAAILRMAGWMGSFIIVAFMLEGFSIDSFALPYLWVALGAVTAAGSLARSQLLAPESTASEPSHHS